MQNNYIKENILINLNMKKFTFLILTALTIVLWSYRPLMAQNDYGTDVIVKNTSIENQTKPSLAVAANGYLYAAFTVPNGYCVYRSTDNGLNWADFHSYTQAARTWDRVKIVTAGTSPLKVFIACIAHTSSIAYTLYVTVYDGETTAYIGETLTYPFTTSLYDLDIVTDDGFPANGSDPYSVGVLYSVHAGTDSVSFTLSTNGGVNFEPRKSVSTTGQYFGKVSLAYGKCANWFNGRYFAVWERRTSSAATVGYVDYAYTTTYNYSPFTNPVQIVYGAYSNKLRNPKIACQYNNIDNDSTNVTAVIVFERFWTNLDNDIVGVYNKKAVQGHTWNIFSIDNSGSRNSKQPDINFDNGYNNFLVTYWDSTNTYLPYVVNGMNMSSPSTWSLISAHYNDNTTMGSLLQPFPVVEINHAMNQVAHLWSCEGTGSNGVVMFDAEYSTVGINETVTYGNDKINNIYPNPAYNNVNIEIELSKSALVQINIYDMSGKKLSNVYNAQTSEGKNTISFDVSSYANGNYIIEMLSNDSRITEKMMVAHQ